MVAACWAIAWLAVWATRGRRAPSLDGLHWTEVARLTWPVRQSVSSLATGLPLVAFALLRALPFAASAVPKLVAAIVAPMLVWLVAAQVGTRISRWWRAATAGLVAASTSMVVAIHFGVALAVARVLGLVATPSARLVAVVAEAARDAGRSAPHALELRSPLATAAALQWSDSVLVSTRTLELLDDAALEAIVRHELAHLGESRTNKLLRSVGSLLLVPMTTLYRPIAATLSPLVAAYVAIGPLFLHLPLRAFARRMEARADALAVAGHSDSEPYVRALVTLYRDNAAPAVTKRPGTHPPLYDRMLAAGVQPDFPRPPPPASDGGGPIGALIAIAILASMVTGATPFRDWLPRDDAQHRAVTLEMLFTGGTAEELGELAEQRLAAGRPDEAITLFSGAIALDDWWGYRGQLATLLADAGRCEEAWTELDLAREQTTWARRDVLGHQGHDAVGSARLTWISEREDALALRCPRDTDESEP